MSNKLVGVIGATSMVGHYALARLTESGHSVKAFSRAVERKFSDSQGVQWHCFNTTNECQPMIENWLCFCPITALPNYFEMLERAGARKVVALSSTSRFTKAAGVAGLNTAEIELSKQLEKAEAQFEAWAASNRISWVILRPTMIYDLVRDKNLSLVVRFIERFGFFPLLGKAEGLRQPVHAGELASASISALKVEITADKDYNISGGEILSYRSMVLRIFKLTKRTPRLVTVPLFGFQIIIFMVRLLPRYRYLSSAMAERMNFNLVFDHIRANTDFGYAPAPFLNDVYNKY